MWQDCSQDGPASVDDGSADLLVRPVQVLPSTYELPLGVMNCTHHLGEPVGHGRTALHSPVVAESPFGGQSCTSEYENVTNNNQASSGCHSNERKKSAQSHIVKELHGNLLSYKSIKVSNA